MVGATRIAALDRGKRSGVNERKPQTKHANGKDEEKKHRGDSIQKSQSMIRHDAKRDAK